MIMRLGGGEDVPLWVGPPWVTTLKVAVEEEEEEEPDDQA